MEIIEKNIKYSIFSFKNIFYKFYIKSANNRISKNFTFINNRFLIKFSNQLELKINVNFKFKYKIKTFLR